VFLDTDGSSSIPYCRSGCREEEGERERERYAKMSRAWCITKYVVLQSSMEMRSDPKYTCKRVWWPAI